MPFSRIVKILTLVSISLAFIFSAGCQAKNETEKIAAGLDTPVAMVDGEYITVNDLLGHPDCQAIVDELIFEKLILVKAKEENLVVTDDQVYETMQPYVEKEGGRAAFLERQHSNGLTLEKIIQFGKVGLLQEQIIDSLLVDPTYDEVVEFLGTDTGRMAYQLRAQELQKKPDEVTVEEVYDMAFERLVETKRRELYDKLRDDILPTGHEVANLLRASTFEDKVGEAWVAAEPSTPSVEPEITPSTEGLIPLPLGGETSTDGSNSDSGPVQGK